MHINTVKITIDFGLYKPSASLSFLIVKAIFLTYLHCFWITFSETSRVGVNSIFSIPIPIFSIPIPLLTISSNSNSGHFNFNSNFNSREFLRHSWQQSSVAEPPHFGPSKTLTRMSTWQKSTRKTSKTQEQSDISWHRNCSGKTKISEPIPKQLPLSIWQSSLVLKT